MTKRIPQYDHIIVISIDTLRSDAIASCPTSAWHAKYRTTTARLLPSILDDIAASSAWFMNCISSAPYTSASHASFLTGCWPLRHGVYELFNKPLEVPTILSNAKDAGYRSMMKVDFPLMLGEHLGFTHNIDEFVVADDDAVLRFIEGNRRTFTFMHFSGAHIPYGFSAVELSGREFAETVKAAEAQYSITPRRGVATAPAAAQRQQRYLDVVNYLYQKNAYDTLFSMYLEGVNRFLAVRFDPALRRILKVVSSRRALLVVFGDHGEEYDAESFAHQNSLSDGVLRVPLMILGDDVVPGRHRSRIRSIDLVPSLRDLISLPATPVDGASLSATIMNGVGYPVRDAFAQSYIADGKAQAEHVKKALLTQETRQLLPHTLLGEAAYVGQWRVVRRVGEQYSEDGAWRIRPVEARVRIERERPDTTWEPVPLPEAFEEVMAGVIARLDQYNELKDSTPAEASPEQVLRDQLRLQGYRI